MHLLRRICILVVVAVAASYGQGMISRGGKPSARAEFSGKPWNSKLIDVASQAGLRSTLVYGGVEKTEYLVETSSGGVAFVDYDRDGWIDLFFGNAFRKSAAERRGQQTVAQ